MARAKVDEASIRDAAADRPDVIVRLYRARSQDASQFFADEVPAFAEVGYAPATVTWLRGGWSDLVITIAIILSIVFIGFFLLAYLLVAEPEGTLTVTYRPIAAE